MNTRKPENAPFLSQGQKIGQIKDFWAWSYSNLQSNIIRSMYAEYVVAMALGIADGTREEWNAYDLDFGNIKVEIKASAYIQAWAQRQHSKPVFSIAPAISRGDAVTGMDKEVKRRADVYVFCLHTCKDTDCLNPLDLDQWDFYVVPTRVFDVKMPNQKMLSLNVLQKLAAAVKFQDIKSAVVNAVA